MGARKIVTAEEAELLSPDARAQLLNDSVVTGLSQVSREFLGRIRDKGRRLLEERHLLPHDER